MGVPGVSTCLRLMSWDLGGERFCTWYVARRPDQWLLSAGDLGGQDSTPDEGSRPAEKQLPSPAQGESTVSTLSHVRLTHRGLGFPVSNHLSSPRGTEQSSMCKMKIVTAAGVQVRGFLPHSPPPLPSSSWEQMT